MAIMTREQYQASIRARKPMNVWFLGEQIKDLTTFPPLAASFNAVSKVYELQSNPDWEDLVTVKSHLNGERVSIYNAPLRSPEDANRKTRAARALAEVIGCCTHRCTGSEAFAGLGPCTYDMDQDLGTHYFERFTKFLDYVQKNDLSCTVTVTDVKGLRSLPPHQQPNRDCYVHVDEIREDGIVISGYKCNQTGILFAHEIIIVPTTNMRPEDKDFALACAVPADSPNITFVLGRTPQDKRFFEVGGDIEGIDLGKPYADHQALVYFDKVFVPNDRVFMCGETKYVGRLLSYFTAVHRLTAGGCKAGGVSALTGAASLVTEMVGVQKAGHIKTKLTEMAMTAETVYALSIASGVEGFQHPSGFWIPNPLLSHTCKYHCTRMPFDAVRYARDIIAGFGDTAPSELDMRSAGVGAVCQAAYNPGNPDYDAFDRLRATRFIEHIIPFSVADMEFETAPEIVSALKGELDNFVLGYANPTEEYLETVCRWMKDRHGWDAKPEWILPEHGIVDAFFNAVKIFTKPGEGVMLMTPIYYPMYHAVKDNGRVLVDCPLVHCGDHYEIDFDDFERKAADENTKMLILCSPHNPTGRVWTLMELQFIAEICLKHHVLVISDEIHFDLVMPGHKHIVYAALSPEAANNCVVCTAPSKTFNLAGLQTSNIFVPNPALREQYMAELKRTNPNPKCNILGYRACEAAYKYSVGWLEQAINVIDRNRKLVVNFMAREFPQIKVIDLEATYLLWMDWRGLGLESKELERINHQEAKLFFDEGYVFGAQGEGFERWNLACPTRYVEEALERMKATYKKYVK